MTSPEPASSGSTSASAPSSSRSAMWTRADRRRGRRIVRLARWPWPPDQRIGRCLQHARAVRRRGGAGAGRHHPHLRLQLSGKPARPLDQGLTMPKLAIRGLNKWFGALEALRNLNLDVERGGFVSVVGPSGCGKTTFLRIVAGLEPASGGEVLIDERVVRGPGGDRGFVLQTDNLLPWRTVLTNASIGPEIAGRSGEAAW